MKRINIYLTEEQEKFLLSIKEESGASLAEIVRRLINKEQEVRGEYKYKSRATETCVEM